MVRFRYHAKRFEKSIYAVRESMATRLQLRKDALMKFSRARKWVLLGHVSRPVLLQAHGSGSSAEDES